MSGLYLGPDSAGQVVQDVRLLRAYKHILEEVIVGNSELLNDIAPNTFGLIEKALVKVMVVGLFRVLFDPQESMGYANMSLERAIKEMEDFDEDKNTTALQTELNDLQDKYEPLRTLRNKVYAHRDREAIQAIRAEEPHELDSVNLGLVWDAIEDVAEFTERVTETFGVTYGTDPGELDGPTLIKALQASR
jgi:hypothetical protein